MSSGVRLARAPRRLRAARPRDIRRRLSALCTAPAATRRAHLDRALPCAVVHHTDCGMEYFKSEELAKLLETSLATASIVPLGSAPKGVTFENASAEGGSHDGHAGSTGCTLTTRRRPCARWRGRGEDRGPLAHRAGHPRSRIHLPRRHGRHPARRDAGDGVVG